MRLIDGDALFDAMEKTEWYNNADRDEVAEKLVMDAPTIEPERETGRWIDIRSGQECDQCHEIQYGYDSGRRFCANCGAKMSGGGMKC